MVHKLDVWGAACVVHKLTATGCGHRDGGVDHEQR
jgi:hypothetical protein